MSLILDKSERYTAYVIMLAEAEEAMRDGNDYIYHGLCYLSRDIFGHTSDIYDPFYHVTLMFPEMKAHYAGKGGFWFTTDKSGWEKRIKILKHCIEETSDF